MKLKIVSLFVFISLSFVLSKCYYDSKEYLYPELSTSCDTSDFRLSTAVKPILVDNCYTCHSNATSNLGKNIRLENYADLKKSADDGSLIGAIKHLPGYVPMPYNGGSLSSCNIRVVQKWIDNQAPND